VKAYHIYKQRKTKGSSRPLRILAGVGIIRDEQLLIVPIFPMETLIRRQSISETWHPYSSIIERYYEIDKLYGYEAPRIIRYTDNKRLGTILYNNFTGFQPRRRATQILQNIQVDVVPMLSSFDMETRLLAHGILVEHMLKPLLKDWRKFTLNPVNKVSKKYKS